MTGGLRLRKAIVATQKELIEYQRTHRLSVRARARLEDAIEVLAQARYVQVGQEGDAYAKAQRVVDFIAEHGIRGIVFGTGVPGL